MDNTGGARYYKKEFWSLENKKYARPHYRLEKLVGIVNGIAGSKECDLLDIGCGPGTVMHFLRPTIHYYGIDIAVPEPAPNLLETDILEAPISFGDQCFDIILAQGLFEYLGDYQSQKFSEIAQLLNENGTFLVSYINFGHRNPKVYWPYSNIQSFDEFRQSLSQYFTIRRYFPTSHNWNHSEPNRKLVKAANMPVNLHIPFLSPKLAVSYVFICSPLNSTEIHPDSRTAKYARRLSSSGHFPSAVPKLPKLKRVPA